MAGTVEAGQSSLQVASLNFLWGGRLPTELVFQEQEEKLYFPRPEPRK